MPETVLSGHRTGPYSCVLRGCTRLAVLIICGAVSAPVAAMEPTPPQPGDEPPAVQDIPQTPVSTRIIVKYVDSEQGRLENLTGSLEAAEVLSEKTGIGLRYVRTLSAGAQLLELSDNTELESAQVQETIGTLVARLNEDPLIEYAEPDAVMQIQQAVNDPLFGQQWHYTDATSGIDLVDGWANATGNGVVVAVVDTGFRPHADLVAHLLPGFDFISNVTVANDGDGRDADASDPGDWISASDSWCPASPRNSSWHGTHVAGTVAAVTGNSLGVAGVARDAQIVPVRVLGKCGGNLSDIADGMRWAAGLAVPGVPANANPANVINLSLGGGGACGPTYQDAIDDIVAAGTTVVVAAGNADQNAANYRPASCNGVITVAATNNAGARSYYSNFGAVVELAAPGGETYQVASRGVLSTLNDGATVPGADSYVFYQGTSMAAPHVAGVAALLYDLDPSITPAQVSTTLQSTSKPFPSVAANQCSTTNCGAGILDAGAATSAISPPSPPGQTTAIPWVSLLLKN